MLITLPSPDNVIRRRNEFPSAFHSMTSASFSHVAVVLTCCGPIWLSPSFPSVVYFRSKERSPASPERFNVSLRLESFWMNFIVMLVGPLPLKWLLAAFIFQVPLRSGLVCPLAIAAETNSRAPATRLIRNLILTPCSPRPRRCGDQLAPQRSAQSRLCRILSTLCFAG